MLLDLNMPKEKIKIFYLINSLIPAGAETVLLQTIKNTDKNKFTPVVCCFEKGRELEKEFIENGIRVINFQFRNKLDIRVIWALYRSIIKEKPVILHTHLAYSGIIGRLVGKILGVPIIISTQHNIAGINNKIISYLDKLTFFLADAIVSVDDAVDRSLFPGQSHNPIKGNQFNRLIIYNGVDINRIQNTVLKTNKILKLKELGLTSSDFIILIVARLTFSKGHEDLIYAFKKIENIFPNAKLVIVGWGELENSLKDLIGNLGLGKKILFLGQRKDIYEILAIADLFVLPYNFKEVKNAGGMAGLAILEAMAAGLPVITTNISGIEKVIKDDITGLLVEQGDRESLARSIETLISNNKKRQTIGQNAKEIIKSYSIKRNAEEYENLYQYMCDKKINKR